MIANVVVRAKTNPEPNTCVDVHCSCEIMWSFAQQFTMRQIVTHTPVHKDIPDYRQGPWRPDPDRKPPAFVGDPEVRARRIAAAYARVFLEDFPHGDKSKIGRFYWLGLGAFASKQVAATLALWQVKYGARWSELYAGLGRGNLWLFNDVLPWYVTYAVDAETFHMCAHSRDSRNMVDQVMANLARQPGYADSIESIPYEIDGETGDKKSKLGYFKCTPLIIEGFEKITKWEESGRNIRPLLAFDHLMAIAQHEQGEVLQGLIYDDPRFQKWLGLQRAALSASDDTFIKSMNSMERGPSDGSEIAPALFIRALVPNLQLVLTSDDATDDPEFRSDAPDRLVLEDYQERMGWINDAASKYHGLMRDRRQEMFDYLEVIKSWGDLQDV